MKPDKTPVSLPTSQEVERELNRVKTGGVGSLLREILCVALVTAAVFVLLTNLVAPLLRIRGDSMNPTLHDGDVVLALKYGKLKRGDICVFYSGSRVLCKRVIGLAGDVIEMDEDGFVTVNGEALSEPYVAQPDLGNCQIAFPYTVPEESYFMLGDNRPVSLDSRSVEVGCVPADRILGKVIFRLWPLPDIRVLAASVLTKPAAGW